MNDEQHRKQLFHVLRQALKSHGYTYKKLSEALDVSELTIKRLFKDQDCKMSRLNDICSVIGLSFSDLVSMQERMSSSAHFLPVEIEDEIVKDSDLFSFFVQLISHTNPQQIAKDYELTDSELYQYLRKLEKLGVLEILENNKIRFLLSLPIRLRLDGRLSEQIKKADLKFIHHCMNNENKSDYSFNSPSRLMKTSTIALIQERLQELQRDFDYMATQDQMFYESDDLVLYKLVISLGRFPVVDLYPMSKTKTV